MSPARRVFPLLGELPAELRGVILEFHWDVELLWSLEFPVVQVQVAELAWHLELPFWAYDGRPFRVSPLEVAADPARYAEQHGRTMATDLQYPLDAVRRPDGRIVILDGVHRLLRAQISGLRSVQVRILEWADLDLIAVLA